MKQIKNTAFKMAVENISAKQAPTMKGRMQVAQSKSPKKKMK